MSIVLMLASGCASSHSQQVPAVLPDARVLSSGAPASGASCTVVPSANVKTNYGDQSYLASVSANSASDVWAAGQFFNYTTARYRTLIEHWNGSAWSIVPSPNATDNWSLLNGVVAISKSNVWAVGYNTGRGTGKYNALIEHWDGNAWSLSQQYANVGALNAVAASGPNDVWAVGTTNFPGRGVIAHYDGKSWTFTRTAIVAQFRAVTAIAPNDVWAVGETTKASGMDNTLTYHFNGSTWTQIPSPSPLHIHNLDQNWLTSVSAISGNNVWATGVTRDGDYGILNATLAEHWDGTKWSVVGSPNPGGKSLNNSLWASVALPNGHVWGVGDVGNVTWQTLTEIWNGSSWQTLTTPQPTNSHFQAITFDKAGHLWATGNTEVAPYVTGSLTELCTP